MDASLQSRKVSNNGNTFSLKKRFLLIAIFSIIILFSFTAYNLFFPTEKKQQTPLKKYQNISDAPHVTNEIIVEFQEGNSPDNLETRKKLETIGVGSFEKVFQSEDPLLKNFYLLKLQQGLTADSVKNPLFQLEEIKGIEFNYIEQASVVIPNDTHYKNTFDLEGFGSIQGQWNLQKIGMPDAWDIPKGSSAIKIAVVDSGIDFHHEDFQNVSLIDGGDYISCDTYNNQGYCEIPHKPGTALDDNGHGTHVSGIIGAATNNARGIAGINWNAEIIAVKTLQHDGRGEVNDAIKSIEQAVNKGARVINLSLGSDKKRQCVGSYQNAITYATKNKAIVVGAAGNSDKIAEEYTPGSCKDVIIVAATDPNDKKASFSNWGARIDISAPGTPILSLRASQCNNCGPENSSLGRYIFEGGTSSAAPHVTAAVALLLSRNSSLSFEQVRECLVKNADPSQSEAHKPIGPRLNVFKVLNAQCAQLLSPTLSPTITPTGVVSSPTSTGRVPTTTPTITPTIIPMFPKENNRIFGELNFKKENIIPELCVAPRENLQMSIKGILKDSSLTLTKLSVQYKKIGENSSWVTMHEETGLENVQGSNEKEFTYNSFQLPKELLAGDYHVVLNVYAKDKNNKQFICSGTPYTEELNEREDYYSCGPKAYKRVMIRNNPTLQNCSELLPGNSTTSVKAPTGSILLSKSCVQTGKNEAITVAIQGEAVDKESPIARIGLHYKKYGSNDSWSDILYKNVADSTSYGERITWNTSSLSEGKYYVVVNIFAHKAGNPFVEKACSGSPYELAWRENKMTYCGSNSRAILNVAKDCSVAARGAPGTPAGASGRSPSSGGGSTPPPGSAATPGASNGTCKPMPDPNCSNEKSVSLCPLVIVCQ